MADTHHDDIESILREGRKFPPTPEFSRAAHVKSLAEYEELYRRAEQDPEAFWGECAKELSWFKPFDKVLEWKFPFAKWFLNGKLNASYNCLDRHLTTARRNKAALIWEGEPGDGRVLTYQMLASEVARAANALKSLGVKEGDRVAIYMPLVPEAVIAMLACARIGAIHSVIFGGFSAEALVDRINDAEAKVCITADGGWRRGQQVPLKPNVDEALKRCPSVVHCVVLRRIGAKVEMRKGRDVWWDELVAQQSSVCAPAELDAEHPLYTLYTSGTTGKPKGVVHATGGYLVHTLMTMKWVFDLKEDDIYWCTADIGWVTGHSYTVYGPLVGRRDGCDVRGGAEFSRERSLLADNRKVPRQHPLYRAHRDPHFHQMGRFVGQETRSLKPAAARHGRRADQSRGLDLVPQGDRRRTLSDRRYLVADRDRRHHDRPDARRDSDQAGLGDAADSGRRRRGRHARRQTRRRLIRAAC